MRRRSGRTSSRNAYRLRKTYTRRHSRTRRTARCETSRTSGITSIGTFGAGRIGTEMRMQRRDRRCYSANRFARRIEYFAANEIRRDSRSRRNDRFRYDRRRAFFQGAITISFAVGFQRIAIIDNACAYLTCRRRPKTREDRTHGNNRYEGRQHDPIARSN